MQAQVFQVAACNWRCWYCFVDYSLLSADPRHAAFLAVSDLVDLYLEELERPRVIDLSGGNPSLVPEWVPWMMQELQRRGLEKEVYLWSDDNLSNEYFWHYLTKAEIELIRGYPNYGKVCCFKGFDGTSFSYNTGASPDFFDRQFEIMKRLLCLGLDIYCYATFTTPTTESIYERMARFIDRQQELDPYLPLRTVPLEIEIYEPVKSRLKRIPTEAMIGQKMAIEAWTRELNARYSDDDLGRRITDIPLQGQNVSQRFRHTEEVN
jgi:uncharacterized Fe-S cluster-containing radical SAM superfamily protein